MVNNLKLILIFVTALAVIGCSGGAGAAVTTHPADKPGEETDPNPRALELFMDAQLSMAQGDYSSAIIDLQDALRIDPNISTIYTSLGESYLQLGRFKLAEERLKKAIELDPKDIESYTLLSHVYLRLQDFKAAENIFNTLKSLDTENIEIYYALANLRREQNDLKGAIDAYLEVYDLVPGYVKPLELASELAFQMKDMILAQKIYSMLAEADSTNKQVLKTYSDLSFINNDTANGLATVKRIAHLPDAGVSDIVRYGAVLFEFGNKDSALAVLMTVLESDSTSSEALHILSQIYRKEKIFTKSKEIAQKHIKYHPGDPQGYINLALSSFDDDRPGDIIASLGQVASKFEKNFSIQYILGMAYYLEKNDSLALVHLNKSVELNQDADQAWHAVANIEEKNKNYEVSDKIYLNLIARDSTDAQARNNYAYSLTERNIKIDEALKLSSQAVELEPDNAAYLDTYGWVFYKRGNFNKALEYIKRSAELNSENDVILEHLGDVYKALNDKEQSLKYYKLALKINPTKKSLQEKIEN